MNAETPSRTSYMYVFTYRTRQWRFESQHHLTKVDGDVTLTQREAQLLKALLEDGRVKNDDGFSAKLVLQLRHKLGSRGRKEFIQTEAGWGYKLNARLYIPVSERSPRATASSGDIATSKDRVLSLVKEAGPADALASALSAYYPHDELIRQTSAASAVWITGLNLSRISLDRVTALRKFLTSKKSNSVMVLMLSPRCDAVRYGVQQDYGYRAEPDPYRRSVEKAFGRFRHLRMEYPGQVELRTVDFPLTFGMDAIDPDTDRGIIYVLFYPVHSDEGDKPILKLRRGHTSWYTFYRNQLAVQWTDFGAQYYLPGNVRVDRAASSDIPAIFKLANSLSPRLVRNGGEGYLRPYSKSEYRKFAEITPYFFVLHCKGDLVGFLLACTSERLEDYGAAYEGISGAFADKPMLIVCQVAIVEAYRHRRLAAGVYDYLFAHSDLNARKYSRAGCVIWQDNKASQIFHEKCHWAKAVDPPWSPPGGELWYRDL